MDQAVTLGIEIRAEPSTARRAPIDKRRSEHVEWLSAQTPSKIALCQLPKLLPASCL